MKGDKHFDSSVTSLICSSTQAAAGSFPPALWRLTPELPSGAPPSPPPAAQLPSTPGQPRERLQHGGRAQGNGSVHSRDLRQQWQRVRVMRFVGSISRRLSPQTWNFYKKPIRTFPGHITAGQTEGGKSKATYCGSEWTKGKKGT